MVDPKTCSVEKLHSLARQFGYSHPERFGEMSLRRMVSSAVARGGRKDARWKA